MLTHLADIFRTPLSQSSARRANVNVFFHWSFFYSNDGLRRKAGAASLLYSNSAFDIKKSLHLPQMIGHLFFRNMYLDKFTSRWSLPPQLFDVHTLLIINTRELPWHTYTEIVFARILHCIGLLRHGCYSTWRRWDVGCTSGILHRYR